MRHRSLQGSALLLAALAACTLTCTLGGAVRADDPATTLPTRKAGLWELKTVMDEGRGPFDQTFKMCVDERMEQNTAAASAVDHKTNCTKYEVKSADGMTTAEGDCLYNGRQVVSHTEMKGDFKSAFEIKISSTTSDPTAKEQSVVIKRSITQAGNYLGDSCGDLKPGEAMGPDGNKIAVQ